ncbi:thioredoxin fold domain-containing protein [Vibrio coralliirubri]|uniref:thioredoxin fold domain-containing protein n=1 Tax=Vibrio coralliirubri TaxID=1516159 RepID=UPI0022851BAD|nr:thioredoxin fold domain-containing protein [Vibrio coralliirubri]MCY9861006.1 thioredoxin fold domain-containing protein [Vibrio coralliirubri]
MTIKKIALLTALMTPMAFAAPSIRDQIPESVYKVLADHYPVEQIEATTPINLEKKFNINSDFYLLSVGDSVIAVGETGEYILGGDIVNLKDKINYAQEAKDNARKRILSAMTEDKYISYPSTQDETKDVVYIYSDVTCGYCVKLHSEYQSINDAGYEIRVVPFLRTMGTKGFETTANYLNSVAMMSEADMNKRRQLHDDLIDGKVVSHQANNQLGVQAIDDGIVTGIGVGLQGTPHIVLTNGSTFSGYMPSQELIKILDK